MIALQGYQIEESLYEGESSIVYRAVRDHDGPRTAR